MECVDSTTRTLFQPSRWRSGWCPSSSAMAPIRWNSSKPDLKFRTCMRVRSAAARGQPCDNACREPCYHWLEC